MTRLSLTPSNLSTAEKHRLGMATLSDIDEIAGENESLRDDIDDLQKLLDASVGTSEELEGEINELQNTISELKIKITELENINQLLFNKNDNPNQ